MKSTAERGYGSKHQAAKRQAERDLAAAGQARCTCDRITCTLHDGQCPTVLKPDDAWDLGHDETTGTGYRGIECVPCNRADGGRRGRATQLAATQTVSREW